MKCFFKSIQWRLQAWHGAILFVVLAAFGCTAYQLAWQNRFQLIDEAIQRQAHSLVDSIAPGPDNPDFLKLLLGLVADHASQSSAGKHSVDDDRAGKASLNSEMLMNPHRVLANAVLAEDEKFYFIFWEKDGTLIRHSTNAPANIPPAPSDASDGLITRTRNGFREHLMVDKHGFVGLIGCPVATDVAELHRQAWLMFFIGGGIALFGLAGGRWLAARAVKPISDMSATVQKISSGNLSQRINVADTDNELGQLAGDLNATFDRLQSAFSQLQSALERQTQFTADASHELRTPVAVILAEANSALARERTPENYREAMEVCRRAARRMHRLRESLLTLARLDTDVVTEHTSCRLDKIARETLELLQPLAREHQINFKTELAEATVTGDVNQLGQVISNLVSNAIFYNRPGGNVWVKIILTNEHVELTVADDGQGISEKDLPHIFDRFYRADESRSQTSGHTGLGLAITKAIVESYRGNIRVESRVDAGSTFTVQLVAQASSL